ncbi:hypothetical protein [Marinomonas posidonica]|uniref:Cutinase n=1 Tax=Marinomonas posidonica (strain CECT 7376 / NCIMB 14433 / IVIA-Po-181) TaxID=491952 RepID=F6CXY6_MARPP|nr:hypothetical protein [Marinomonas posidonica]AEF54548.1 hypothetical protein Mar181_1505 [Marinomonas posidonica IVIA-Po-181]
MIKRFASVPSLQKMAALGLAALALYAPVKDLMDYTGTLFAKQTIQIVDVSFGANMPWQKNHSHYLNVSNNAQTSLSRAQVIYTKLRFENPTSEPQTYRKIWLNFSHDNGDQEYTTDYTLYNKETRQRLIGQSVQVGPNSSVDVIAAYRFIPSYKHKSPISMSVSWEGKSLLREKACEYGLANTAENAFYNQCGL